MLFLSVCFVFQGKLYINPGQDLRFLHANCISVNPKTFQRGLYYIIPPYALTNSKKQFNFTQIKGGKARKNFIGF